MLASPWTLTCGSNVRCGTESHGETLSPSEATSLRQPRRHCDRKAVADPCGPIIQFQPRWISFDPFTQFHCDVCQLRITPGGDLSLKGPLLGGAPDGLDPTSPNRIGLIIYLALMFTSTLHCNLQWREQKLARASKIDRARKYSKQYVSPPSFALRVGSRDVAVLRAKSLRGRA